MCSVLAVKAMEAVRQLSIGVAFWTDDQGDDYETGEHG